MHSSAGMFVFLSHRYIQSTCATSGEGLYEGLDWLSNNIANKVILFPVLFGKHNLSLVWSLYLTNIFLIDYRLKAVTELELMELEEKKGCECYVIWSGWIFFFGLLLLQECNCLCLGIITILEIAFCHCRVL